MWRGEYGHFRGSIKARSHGIKRKTFRLHMHVHLHVSRTPCMLLYVRITYENGVRCEKCILAGSCAVGRQSAADTRWLGERNEREKKEAATIWRRPGGDDVCRSCNVSASRSHADTRYILRPPSLYVAAVPPRTRSSTLHLCYVYNTSVFVRVRLYLWSPLRAGSQNI